MDVFPDRDLPWYARVLGAFAGVVLGIAMFTVIILAVGLTVDRITEHRTEIESCQKRALTPYDYHRC